MRAITQKMEGFQKWKALLVLALLMCFGAGEAWAQNYSGTYYFSSAFANHPSGQSIGCTASNSSSGWNTAVVGYTSIPGGTVTGNSTFNIMQNNLPVTGTVTINSGATLTVNIKTGSQTLYAWAKTCGFDYEHTHDEKPGNPGWAGTLGQYSSPSGCWYHDKNGSNLAWNWSWNLVCPLSEHHHSNSCYSYTTRTATNNNYDYSQPALLRAPGFTGQLFHVNSGGKLIINGPSGQQLIIDGNKNNVAALTPLIYNFGTLEIDRVTLRNNINANTTIYQSNGGAIATYDTFTMKSGEITGCSARDNGGGVFVGGGTATFTKGNIHHNVCRGPESGDGRGRGGGIAASAAQVYFNSDDVLIHDNECKHYGGGVQAASGGELHFSAGKIYNNFTRLESGDEANASGAAGIHITGGTILRVCLNFNSITC